MATVLFWTVLGFFSGSLMLAYWLGHLVLHADVRTASPDGNPGAGNVWRAGGGWRLGVPAALLDYSKAALPVALAHYGSGVSGWSLVPVGLAPFLGHVFSPFLGFRGGKGVAATFGMWTGLTGLGGPLALGVATGVVWRLQTGDGWSMVWGMLGLLTYLVVFNRALPLLTIWAIDLVLIAWRHRKELREPARLRSFRQPRVG